MGIMVDSLLLVIMGNAGCISQTVGFRALLF